MGTLSAFLQSSLLSPALITKCFRARCLDETRPFVTAALLWVAGRYSAGVWSTPGGECGCYSYLFLTGKERIRPPSRPGERCCCLPCQGTGCPASALGGCEAPRCGVQGQGADRRLPRTCVTTCLRQARNQVETGETSLVETGSQERRGEGKTRRGRDERRLAGWLGPDWQEMRAVESGQGWVHMGTVVGEILG